MCTASVYSCIAGWSAAGGQNADLQAGSGLRTSRVLARARVFKPRRPRARSWGTQFRVLFRRALRAQLRNPTDATSRLLMSTCVGLLAGARPRLRATAVAVHPLPLRL